MTLHIKELLRRFPELKLPGDYKFTVGAQACALVIGKMIFRNHLNCRYKRR